MSYSENMYRCLSRKNYLVQKYNRAGIYSISIDDELVYIGKSYNMLKRIAEHMVGIKLQIEKKYSILAQNQSSGKAINFDVLYYAKQSNYRALEEELGSKEGEYIRRFMPRLNTQIPNEHNWRKFTTKSIN